MSLAQLRWFQFRLRTLLAAITVASIVFAWWFRMPAIRSVQVGPKENDFYCIPVGAYSCSRSPVPVIETTRWLGTLSPSTIRDDDLKRIAALQPSDVTLLSCPHITDAGIRHLANVNGSEPVSFIFHGCHITGSCLDDLQRVKNLDYLSLSRCPITDESLTHIRNLNALRFLNLNECPITDTGVQKLPVERLNSLLLCNTAITDTSLSLFGKMQDGATLELEGTQITDAGFSQVAELAKRLIIFVNGSKLSAERQQEIVQIQADYNLNPWTPEGEFRRQQLLQSK